VILNGTISILYEWYAPVYAYFPASYATSYSDRIYVRTCTTGGVLGPAPTTPLIKGAGLASRAFIVGSDYYFAICYSKRKQLDFNSGTNKSGLLFCSQ
jgi:hypothetical protein